MHTFDRLGESFNHGDLVGICSSRGKTKDKASQSQKIRGRAIEAEERELCDV